MEVDYIIVGCGLAGISFAEVLIKKNKSFVVINDSSQNSTKIAGGLFNPVVLKRFTEAWQASRQVEIMYDFYYDIERRLGCKLFFDENPVVRKFFSTEEQNNWFTASDKSNLSKFLSEKILFKNYDYISSEFGFGKVNHSGYVDTFLLQSEYSKFLSQKGFLVSETFDYNNLNIVNTQITYNTFKARKIVFAEGFGIHKNPYFNYLPLDGTKGELLVIKAPKLNIDAIINASVFILPLGNGLFKVGATYNWNDKTNLPTLDGKEELIAKLEELISCDFEIVDHLAGIRPTVNDRKPLLGQHPKFSNLFVLNGLGTRGVMLGPDMAQQLYNFIENGIELDREVNINRYVSRLLS